MKEFEPFEDTKSDARFEKPADDIAEYESIFPEACVFLRDHGMERLSFDELLYRWKWKKDILPAMREQSAFFEAIPAMRRATEFYQWHVETHDNSLVRYARFFTAEFRWFLADRGWESLSFSDLESRFVYFATFDKSVAERKQEFAMICRIHQLWPVEKSRLNLSMSEIVHDPVWGFSPAVTTQLEGVLERRGWQNIFDAFIIFWTVHHHYILDHPDLIPHGDFFERVFHCATEFLILASDGHTHIPAGNWFGPRILFATDHRRRHRLSDSGISVEVITGLFSVLIIWALGWVDSQSERPYVMHQWTIDFIRMRCEQVLHDMANFRIDK